MKKYYYLQSFIKLLVYKLRKVILVRVFFSDNKIRNLLNKNLFLQKLIKSSAACKGAS